MTRAVVVGGGIAGVSAALDLARRGADVTVLERGSTLGGLVASFEIGGTPIERHVLKLVDDLGLTESLGWYESSVGIYAQGRVWPFTSPVDLMRFEPLPLADRLVTGVGALRLARTQRWEALDEVPAIEWLRSYTTDRAADVVWGPLLRAKFGPAAPTVPAAWMWGRFRQRAGARRGGRERLGYLSGGFVQVFDRAADELRRLGATVRTGVGVARVHEGGVELDEGTTIDGVDAVLYTGPLPGIRSLVAGELHDPRWHATEGLGVQCVVLELPAPVTDVYWTNVCDPDVPFGGIIEHTNLVPPDDYGCHVVYLSRYFTADEPIATVDADEEAARWIAVLAARFPRFDPTSVAKVHAFRAAYAAPLVSVGHRRRIPPMRAPMRGLYVATTAQIYPEDRGMSEGVRLGLAAADAILADQPRGWRCPACGEREHEQAFGIGNGTEGGVDADAFRPSASAFGTATAAVLRCVRCGHAAVEHAPPAEAVARAYTDAVDPVSRREEPGQVETARRDLARIERTIAPGRLLDVGCWTGSFVAAAVERGWTAYGIEPSEWAVGRAKERGLDVHRGDLFHNDLPRGATFDLVVLTDVIEHLADPGAALDAVADLCAAGGHVFLTLPDAGSALARLAGRRWWSVLPMHLQYFTRASLARLLDAHGFDVVWERTHAKVFSARYYAERVGGYEPRVARAAVRAAERAGVADRLIAPDLRDRMAVLARRR